MIRKIINRVDVVLEVLDIRDPHGTRSKEIEDYVRRKKKVLLLVLNKCDLVAKESAEKIKRDLSGIAPAVFISATKKYGTKKLRGLVRRHVKKFPVKIAIVGYPNVGKSQLCNALKGKTSAPVAPVPGFTKGEQWIRISKDIMLFDTPGVIPRKESEKSLALKGALDADKVKDPEAGAIEILKYLLEEDEETLFDRYGMVGDPEEMLVAIARKRGKLKKGGEPDTVAAAKIVIREWYRGVLWKGIKTGKTKK